MVGPDGALYAGECGRRPVSLIALDPTSAKGRQRSGEQDSGQQIDIVSIHGMRTPEDIRETRRSSVYAAPDMAGRRAYRTGLAWPPPALSVAENGEVWASTTGAAAHLLWMPRAFNVVDVGKLPGIRTPAAGLVLDARGRLFGAGREPGGELFSCDTDLRVESPYYNVGAPPEMHGPVFDDDVAAVAISADRRYVAAPAERSGRIAFIDTRMPNSEPLRTNPPAEPPSPSIVADCEDGFYGLDADGRLYSVSVDGVPHRSAGGRPTR